MTYRYVTNMYKGFKETCIRLFNNLRADAILTRTGTLNSFNMVTTSVYIPLYILYC